MFNLNKRIIANCIKNCIKRCCIIKLHELLLFTKCVLYFLFVMSEIIYVEARPLQLSYHYILPLKIHATYNLYIHIQSYMNNRHSYYMYRKTV